jgi:hypothetical protein
MTTRISFRDVEKLSAYLDGELRQADRTRLEGRLAKNADLRSTLEDLRQARELVRLTPRHRAPRNFTLTPKMAHIKAPVPRAVPALGWASVLATLILVFSFAGNLITFGAGAPMSAAPLGKGGGGYGVGGGAPDDTAMPTMAPAEAPATTATPEMATLMGLVPTVIIEPTMPPPAERFIEPQPENISPAEPSDGAKPKFSLSTLQIVLLVLVFVLGGASYLVGWLTERTFQRRLRR